ncbi:hypothetical protein BDV93DRAFT_307517 [Ceratobasidium sp. AG-I]|nr:hypothetical protein BDV93DRAFT_307517 [Ceratobasidium sp. AG-I]
MSYRTSPLSFNLIRQTRHRIPISLSRNLAVSCTVGSPSQSMSEPPRVTLTPPPSSAVRLPTSPVPKGSPLGEGRSIKTAACLIIGDEILNGKTHDSNSNYLAKFCFERGIAL